MKAAVLHEIDKPLVIEDIRIDKPGPREVLVRTAYTGVCHSDLHFIEGKYPSKLPLVLGHESAGIVEEVGALVQSVKKGDHVITCLSIFCGRCDFCLGGRMSLCVSGDDARGKGDPPRLSSGPTALQQFVGLGSFAEQLLVHENALVAIRPDMPLDRAAVIGCAVTTGVGAVHNTAKVEVGSTVAVIGCGGVGLSCINGASIAGASRILALDSNPAKLALAKEFGATDLVDVTKGDPVKQVRELTGGGVHYAFEAIGLKVTAEQAFRMVRRGGTATIIGMVPVGTMVEIHGPDLMAGKRLQGSVMGSNRFPIDMPRYVDFYLAGRLHLDKMISQVMPLERINEAFADMKSGKVARTVIRFDH